MFELTQEELKNLRSQFVTSNEDVMGRTTLFNEWKSTPTLGKITLYPNPQVDHNAHHRRCDAGKRGLQPLVSGHGLDKGRAGNVDHMKLQVRHPLSGLRNDDT